MPELPEVETIRRVITPLLAQHTVTGVEVLCPTVIAHPSADDFCALITGQTFEGSLRRGKYLRFLMRSGDTLTLHLRMTGGLVVLPCSEPPEKHTRLILGLTGGVALHFSDQRRLGRAWFLPKDTHDSVTGMQSLGPEPFDLPEGYLQNALHASRRAIKEALMDQHIIAGIGNIYADEILYAARIHPCMPCCTLSAEDYTRLSSLIPDRMTYFLAKNAISTEDYQATRGREYRNTPCLLVYNRQGLPCAACGTKIEKRFICGRGSHFCPACQIMPIAKTDRESR